MRGHTFWSTQMKCALKGCCVMNLQCLLVNNCMIVVNNLTNAEGQMKIDEKDEKIICIEEGRTSCEKQISDDEINALFLGLAKIVKKAALESANKELRAECEMSKENFRITLIDLNRTQMELKKSRTEISKLNAKIENQQKQICNLMKKLSNCGGY